MTARRRARTIIGRAVSLLHRSPTAGRILLYHRIGEDGDPVMCVKPRRFRDHLEALAASGSRVAAVRELIDAGWPAGRVAMSFDDGDASAGAAATLLLERGWSATLFVVPEWVGRAGRLAWGDLAELARAGCEIGSHGLAHEPLCDADAGAVTARLETARAHVQERLGVAAEGLAYPFGLFDGRASAAAARAGHRYACTTLPGRNDAATPAFLLHRNEVFGDDDAAALRGKLAGSDDWMALVRRAEVARRCRARARASA